MSRASIRVAELVGMLALLSVLSCGGSSATQRDDESPKDEVGDVGGGESAADSDAQDDAPPGDDALADEGPAGDPVENVGVEGDDAVPATGGATSTRKFKTSESPEKMSEFLVKPAKEAMKGKKYPNAISLYAGLVAARGKGDDAALELGKAWNLEAQLEEAARVFDDFAAHTRNDKKRIFAQDEAERLREFEEPFQRTFAPDYAKQQAVEAFGLGRKAQKKKKWADALFYFEVAGAIDPTLNGVVREIGASYSKLGANDDATNFYLDYLWRSPVGKFTKDILKELKKLKKTGELGYLNVQSKLPCDEVWVEGQLAQKLPIKKLAMAPGKFTWLCYSGRYGMAYFESIVVEKGKTKTLEFAWAILVDDLKNPYGRIFLEDARRPGVLKYIGMDPQYSDHGVVVPKDGSALKMHLKGLNGAVIEERFVRIKPGDKLVVTWKKP